MIEIKLSKGIVISDIENRIREYCQVEIYHGYDDYHEVNNTITLENINAANKLFARISKPAAERIIHSEMIRNSLAVIDYRELGEISEEEWRDYKEKLYNLFLSFFSIKGAGIAVATKILHLKRPKLIPILDSFVVKFLTEIDTQNVLDKQHLAEIGVKTIGVIREDIRRNLESFTKLRQRLSDLPIPLSKVRLYDILVWSTEKWDIRGDLKAPFGVPYKSIRGRIYEITHNYEPKEQKKINDVWVNVDKLTKKCTIHTNSGCRYLANKRGTRYKGIGELKRDGGWLSFPTLTNAENYCKTKHQNYKVKKCC